MKRLIVLLNQLFVIICLLFPAPSMALDNWLDKGLSLLHTKRYKEAIDALSKAIEENPRDATAFSNRGVARYQRGEYSMAIADYRKAMDIDPDLVDAYNQLARALAVCPESSCRDGTEAMELALRAAELDPGPDTLDTLAAAYAEAGRFENAVATQKRVITLKKQEGKAPELTEYIDRLKSYRAHVPWRENAAAPLDPRRRKGPHPTSATAKFDLGLVFERPTTESTVIRKLKKGEKVKRIHQEGEWYIVRLSDGQVGWARQGLLTEEGVTPEAAHAVKHARAESKPDRRKGALLGVANKDRVTLKFPINRIRVGPSLQAKIDFLLEKGETLSVLDRAEDWYFVELGDGRRGWAHRSLFRERPSPPEPLPLRPYSLYLGSFRTLDRSKRAIRFYNKKNLTSYGVKVDLGAKGVWYRVFVGQFVTRQQAERYKAEFRLVEATVKKTKYASLVGTYDSSDELKNRKQSLAKLGYSTYVIKGQGGESRLFVGAFMTKKGAESQYQDLKSKGVQSQVVER